MRANELSIIIENIELILRGFVALCEKKCIDEVSLWVIVTPLVEYHTR